MRFERSVCLPIFAPSLICGLSAGIGVYSLDHNLFAAGLVVSAFLVSSFICVWIIQRSGQKAGALLRRPELRSREVRGTGVYESILREVLGLVEQFELQANSATECKTDLEARNRVRLKESYRLELALNSVDDPLLITDVRGQIQFLNTAAKKIFTLMDPTESESDSARDYDLSRITPLYRLLDETLRRNAANDSRKTEFDLDIASVKVTYQATITNISDGNSELLGAVLVLHDATEDKQEKTHHAEFVSSVCHELKTPLAGIKAYNEMLLDGDVTDPDEQREMFNFIDSQVDRVTRMINNMLNLTRIESGVVKVQREDCELNDVLRNAFGVVLPTAEEKKIQLVSELSELYLPAHLDLDLFGQAIINLLSNAVKYTPTEGEIRLRSRMEENQLIVEVRDNGMGIPEKSQPHIFERFYRVPENNSAAEGTGLGLSPVHYIVTELHNGSISVASLENEGTCFTLSLPLGHKDQGRKKQTETVCAS